MSRRPQPKSGCSPFLPDRKYRVQCFGKFALYRNSDYIPIPCAKAKELLSLLTLENGGPLSKRHIASLLWPDSNEIQARDCLYKTLRWLRRHAELLSIFNLRIERNVLSACLDNLQIDLVEFNRCYAQRDNIRSCETAIELYQGPLFWKEYYEWTSEYQSEYEIRCSILIHQMAVYCEQQGNVKLRDQYLHLADEFMPIL